MLRLTLLLTTGFLSLCVAEVFHVTPNLPATLLCPSPCHTLDQYAQNTSLLAGHTNISLVFLKGVHSLNYSLIMSGLDLNSNTTIIVFRGQGFLPGDTVINLMPLTFIYLHDAAHVRLVNIRVETNMPLVNGYDYIALGIDTPELHPYITCENIHLVQYHQVESKNIITDISSALTTIDESFFMNSKLYLAPTTTANSSVAIHNSGDPSHSSSRLEFQDCSIVEVLVSCRGTICNITVDSSNVTNLSTVSADSTLIQNSQFVDGLYGIWAYNPQKISILGCIFLNNEFAGIHIVDNTREISMHESPDSISIHQCQFFDGQHGILAINPQNSTIMDCEFKNVQVSISASPGYFHFIFNADIWIQNCTIFGGNFGIIIYGLLTDSQQLQLYEAIIQNTSNVHVTIESTSISSTKSLGLLLYKVSNVTMNKCLLLSNEHGVFSFNTHVDIHNTFVTKNIVGLMTEFTDPLIGTASIRNCTFSENEGFGLWLIESTSSTGIVVTDCSFYENQGTPIIAHQSRFELSGTNVFRDNLADRGGGLALYDSATVIFGPESNTMFINNTAEEFGGAIFIATLFESTLLFTDIELFYAESTIKFWSSQTCFYSVSNTMSKINFADNEAILGGHDVYGAVSFVEDCNLLNNTMFKFNNKSHTYQISSNPTRVCFCVDNMPQCTNKTYLTLNETRFPGENFSTSVVLAGHYFGRVAGSVYTNVLGRDYREVIQESQHVQNVDQLDCDTLSYTIYSNELSDSVVLVLTAQEQLTHEQDESNFQANLENIYSAERCSTVETCFALLYTPIYINVTLQPCPLGFELDPTNRICVCGNKINSVNLTCDIQNHTGYIIREGTVWVGVDPRENNTDIYYWHRFCPKDYCIHSSTSIDLLLPDKQCSSYRSGILCGKCQSGYSLTLGGNKCIKCNNSYLALLTVFAILGILLVALIKLLDFTVTSGVVNGLIFYANIVWINNDILFSMQDRQNIGYYVITVPIAWINLDFGIETCFSKNLNQLTKTGLQFVFPVYIWCIAGLIIIISRYSTRATKLFGSNSVSVLATLFLLSYGKIFKNITEVFIFADVTDSNGTIRKVWSLDGNVRYGETPGHIVLMVVALPFALLLLPFTLTLLLVPLLRAKSHIRPFHWINTQKPFFDAYYGPFKDKKQHQMWTGILLLSRVVILVVFTSTSSSSPKANILVMIIISTLLLMYNTMGPLYKKWSLSLLENTYIVNLILLGGAFLSSEYSSKSILNPVVTTSVVMALISFICTVGLYTAKRMKLIERIQKYFKKEEVSSSEEINSSVRGSQQILEPTVHVIEIKKYDPTVLRETLLEELETLH